MKPINFLILIMLLFSTSGFGGTKQMVVEVYETSASGHKLMLINQFEASNKISDLYLLPEETYQTITGFGGSFTESSAYLLNSISKPNREKILKAYFSQNGANYTLTRTHLNSCDFSLGHYTYAPVENDKELKNFSIKEDENDLIPMIKDAMAISKQGFKIVASPWTAPPWMKDNKDWRGGKLLPEYYDTWSLFFSKYLKAYKAKGINIWALTVENEPLGCGDNWESMHFSPEEMTYFVNNHLGPKLKSENQNVILLGYDQNRDELKNWADVMYKDEESSKYYGGIAIHWYASTYNVFAEALQHAHKANPAKYLIQTEACLDGLKPAWQNDTWYWSKEAKDWGWDWAPEDKKYLHPKYVPVYRYAGDIIGCLNNWVNGWIDWNMVLDNQGGPNWFKNWCGAPILVDPQKDEVYITPIYYVMSHFSKFIRPGAKRIGFKKQDESLDITAVQNPDGSIAVVILNKDDVSKSMNLILGNTSKQVTISAQSLQTIIIRKS